MYLYLVNFHVLCVIVMPVYAHVTSISDVTVIGVGILLSIQTVFIVLLCFYGKVYWPIKLNYLPPALINACSISCCINSTRHRLHILILIISFRKDQHTKYCRPEFLSNCFNFHHCPHLHVVWIMNSINGMKVTREFDTSINLLTPMTRCPKTVILGRELTGGRERVLTVD